MVQETQQIKKRQSDNNDNSKKSSKPKMSTTKKIGIGAAVVGTVLAAYGTYKCSKYLKSEAGRRATQAGINHLKSNIDTGRFIKNNSLNSAVMNSKEWGKKTSLDLIRDTNIANKVSGSTKEAIKYLYNNRKK